MRRASIVCVLLLAGCAYRPVFVEPHPGTGEPGRAGGAGKPTLTPSGNSKVCRETGRVACALEDCGGPRLDLVTIHCPGEPAFTRCVANTGCSTR
ncbi:MAG TPA: hypothetical protein VE974_14415 [Thermoanaerobaculia bacterium]|nr:hypothetical protein [Thermoanaerobaculia bacterium]